MNQNESALVLDTGARIQFGSNNYIAPVSKLVSWQENQLENAFISAEGVLYVRDARGVFVPAALLTKQPVLTGEGQTLLCSSMDPYQVVAVGCVGFLLALLCVALWLGYVKD